MFTQHNTLLVCKMLTALIAVVRQFNNGVGCCDSIQTLVEVVELRAVYGINTQIIPHICIII